MSDMYIHSTANISTRYLPLRICSLARLPQDWLNGAVKGEFLKKSMNYVFV